MARPLLRSTVPTGLRRDGRPAQPGFTLVELVVTLVIIGILAAFVLPRFMSANTYAARAAQDQLISAARYAQQVAMLKGPGAGVRFVLNNATYQIEVAGVPLTLPGGGGTRQTLADVRTNSVTLDYTSLGNTRPSTLTITGRSVTRKVCISATGYAYAC